MAYKIVNKPNVSDIIEHAAKEKADTFDYIETLKTFTPDQQRCLYVAVGMVLEALGITEEMLEKVNKK